MLLVDLISLTLIGVLLCLSIWSFYNIPIFAIGVRNFLKNRQKPQRKSALREFPTFSIIIPVKNEERVIGRIINALSKLDYPEEKKDIIIVEDASSDRSLDICMEYSKKQQNLRILHRPFSMGKPSALNYGLKYAKGEIIAIFDADNVPALDALSTVAQYFEDKTVAAVQGKTLSLNSKENMITQFSFYEEAVWCEVYLRGKDVLNLFVHLKGSCQFIRRNVLEKLDGFNETSLCEDMEISARLMENNYKIRYAPDVVALQESPSDLKTLFRQRTRWFRGTMEVALKYGRLLSRFNLKTFDAEATLFAPFILVASLMPYLAASWVSSGFFPSIFWAVIVFSALLTTGLSILLCGLALVYVSKPRALRNLIWFPFVFFYWSFQAFIAIYALILIILRRPKDWFKTNKQGLIVNI